MIRPLARLRNLPVDPRNLDQILQNLLPVRNLKSGFYPCLSMIWDVLSRFWTALSEICSEIWFSCFKSMPWSRFQISDFRTLKGRCSPAGGGGTTTYPGRSRGCRRDPDRASLRRRRPRTAKHQTAVVFHHRSYQEETTMADPTLIASTRDAIPDLPQAACANPTILALDLGTTTGWALRSADGLITSGTVSFRPSRYDGGGMRYLRFRAWLEQLAEDAGPIGATHFEEVRRHVGTDAAHVFGGLLATLTAWAEAGDIAYQGVPVGTIKRHVTGKGNANKEAMIAAVQARGFTPADDNEADAIAILLWAIETKGGVQ